MAATTLHTDFYTTCPGCGCKEFALRVDDAGDRWSKILGTECLGCGALINWCVVENPFTDEAPAGIDTELPTANR